MRLFGVRATSMAMGLGLLAAMLGVLGGGSDGPTVTRYEVTAELLLATDGRVFACYAYLLSFPDGCGGIEVRAVDLSQIRGLEGYPSDGQGSTPQRLVGTWDGQALTLTETPQPAKKALGLPEPCKQELGYPPGQAILDLQQSVAGDHAAEERGIRFLETMPCEGTLGIVVPVADEATITWLTSRYRTVTVVGWLQPVTSGW